MKIAICDDVKHYNDHLNELLTNYMKQNKIENYKISKYTSGVDLLKEYKPGLFNFIFLDIDMPNLDGFATAKRIKEIDFDAAIVFVTNMHEHVQKGYSYRAKAYLYKPIDQTQINDTMDDLIEEHLQSKRNGVYAFKVKNGANAYLSLTNILYFESHGHDVSVVTETESLIFLGKISTIAEGLADNGFVRINKSVILNTAHVFKDFGDHVTLKRGEEFTVSPSYKQKLREELKKLRDTKWKI